MKLNIVTERGNREVGVLQGISGTTTISQLKSTLFDIKNKSSKFNVNRIKLSTGDRKSLEDSKCVNDYQLKENDTLLYKDLGPQIGWSTVFVAEYAGPLLLYPVFYYFAPIIYGLDRPKHSIQTVALICYSLHYLKRILETIFIHRFSHGTMPLRNLFKNCSYYWGCTIMVSYFVNHPLFTAPSQTKQLIGLTLWAVGEISNFICHYQLMNLRPPGTTERRIPRGFLFELLSCPNYTVEILAWLGFSIMTQTLTAFVFTLMGAAQMWVWAVGKHRRYRKDFPNYPKSRKILIPFLL
ncbi:synaptic glycoprotein SC2-like protein [Tieghemostelium lacteum]|uniref:very-long-chain enoyl-CoA reductase n=1 Tax=Tieghemostelium lacteum TaxID=361077 RepID=A0A151ZJF2_TIELA|nr:synaptic glycoprotein SC2-like protein [Tieghemostelium lacteum]|eukprot:KYQ94029.1 synaptic glycoprotein SC2-like protein [Tieghemostelium lacteum]